MDKQTIDAMKLGLIESETSRTKLKAMGKPTKSIDDAIAQMKKMIAENEETAATVKVTPPALAMDKTEDW